MPPNRPKGRGGGGECPDRLSPGRRLKAIAVDLVRLLNSPSTWNAIHLTVMKKAFLLPALCLSFSLLAKAEQQPALLFDPPDGSAPPPVEARYTFKPAEVVESTVTRQGGRDVIVQRVALDPNDPVKPVVKVETPVKTPSDSPPSDMSLPPEYVPPSYLLLLSATVHPGPLTYLRWTHYFADGDSQEFSGWSNIDFNHLTGISSFLGTDGETHTYMMGIGTTDDAPENAPAFPSTTPTFIPDQESIPAAALVTVDSLHKLYAIEKEKLIAAHAGRKRAEDAREAELLANPPQPKDLIIRYRVAETPLGNEGGAE